MRTVLPVAADDDLAEDEPAAERVVGEAAPRRRQRRCVAQHVDDVRPVGDAIEISRKFPHGRQPRSMGQHVADRRALLALLRERRDVVGNAIVEANHAALVEQVHHHRGDGLRCREEREQRVVPCQHLRCVGRIVRRVPAQVTDRAVDDDATAMAQREREGGVQPGAIQPDDRGPDGVDVARGHADVTRVDLGGDVAARDGVVWERRGHTRGGSARGSSKRTHEGLDRGHAGEVDLE